MKINITKKQLRIIAQCIWSPDNMKEGLTKQITKNTWRMLNKGHE